MKKISSKKFPSPAYDRWNERLFATPVLPNGSYDTDTSGILILTRELLLQWLSHTHFPINVRSFCDTLYLAFFTEYDLTAFSLTKLGAVMIYVIFTGRSKIWLLQKGKLISGWILRTYVRKVEERGAPFSRL